MHTCSCIVMCVYLYTEVLARHLILICSVLRMCRTMTCGNATCLKYDSTCDGSWMNENKKIMLNTVFLPKEYDGLSASLLVLPQHFSVL